VAVHNVANRAAIGDNVTLEAPFAAQLILQQELIGAGGLAVNAVVGAHHAAGLALGNGGAKGGQIGVQLVVLAYGDIGAWRVLSGPLCTAKCLGVEMTR